MSTPGGPAMPADIVGAVREATENAGRRPTAGRFSLTAAGASEKIIAPILGIYLGYAVVRLPEVFTFLAIPKLPMILMAIFILLLLVAVPGDAWRAIWQSSKPLRLMTIIVALAVITAPIGIWPSGSFSVLQNRYIISVVIFLAVAIFLRDRVGMRRAVMLFVLCTAAVSADAIRSYDPNAMIYDDDGVPLDPATIAARPELRRITVGVSLDSNDFGAVLCLAFPLALWLSVGNFFRRVFWTGMAGVMIGAVTLTQSRGSMLGFGAAAVILIGAGARGWRRIVTLVLMAGGAGVFVMMATGIGAFARFSDFSEDDYNISGSEGRWHFWKQGFVWMLKRPWGYGILNYPTYFGILNGPEKSAHSSWVQYGVELGVAGLATFALLCWTLWHGLSLQRRQAALLAPQDPRAAEEATLAGHMMAMLAGVLVTGSFLSNAYYPLMYMALGLAAATLLGSPLPKAPKPVPAAEVAAPAGPAGIRRKRPPRPGAPPGR